MQVILNGIIIGSGYALLTLGFTLIFSAVRFYHMLYGGLAVLGVFFMYSIQTYTGLDIVSSTILSAIITGFIGMASWQYIYLPLKNKKASNLVILVASFGALIVAQNLIALIWGNSTHSISISETILPGYSFWGLSITFNQIIILLTSITFMIILEVLLNKTKYGMAIRAIGDNPELTTILGLRTNQITLMIFYIGTFLSVISATLVGLERGFRPSYCLAYVLTAIICSIIGGIGSMRGALVGGFVLGIAENIGIYYFGAIWMFTTSYVLFALFLLLRPEGIFKQKILDQ